MNRSVKPIAVSTLICLLSAAILAGCGGSDRPSLTKVSGTVTLDGQPLEGAMVSFQYVADEKSKYQRPSSGVTDAQGKFTLGTYDKDDGLPVGKYKVAIQKRELVGQLPPDYNEEMAGSYNLTYKWITPRSYSSPETSGLEAEVTRSELKPAVFDLKTNGAQPEIERTGPQARARVNEP
jgi:hypothetical protein